MDLRIMYSRGLTRPLVPTANSSNHCAGQKKIWTRPLFSSSTKCHANPRSRHVLVVDVVVLVVEHRVDETYKRRTNGTESILSLKKSWSAVGIVAGLVPRLGNGSRPTASGIQLSSWHTHKSIVFDKRVDPFMHLSYHHYGSIASSPHYLYRGPDLIRACIRLLVDSGVARSQMRMRIHVTTHMTLIFCCLFGLRQSHIGFDSATLMQLVRRP
jgi:hypothetical protein